MLGRIFYVLGAVLVSSGCGGGDFTSSSEGAGGAGPGSTGSPSSGPGASASSGGGGCTCAPPVPAGWEGPAMLHHGTGMAPTCSAEWSKTIEAHTGNVTADFSCSQCSCDPPKGVMCSPHDIGLHVSFACDGTAEAMVTPTGACQNLGAAYNGIRLYGLDSVPSGGTCAAAGGVATKGAPVWDEQVVVCTGVAGGNTCDGGGVCAPTPSASFVPGLCIHQDGNVDCPDPFVDKWVAYRGVMDDRVCGECSCGDPSGSKCDMTNYAYTDPSCTENTTLIGPFCETAPASKQWIAVSFWPQAHAGSCSANQGLPAGELNIGLPVTICCQPGS